MKPAKENPVAATDRLRRVRVAMLHVESMWAIVLQRLAYLKGFNENEQLGTSLNQTRAANVHNAIQDVLLGDLLLQINALVLDRNQRSASVAIAVSDLKDAMVLEALRDIYRAQARETPRMLNEQDFLPEARTDIANHVQQQIVQLKLKECDSLPQRLAEITDRILDSEVGRRIRNARNKTVAHYDIVRDGQDWKLWKLRDIGLTYSELIDYVENCTSDIKVLTRFVGRGVFDFSTATGTAETYIAEYTKALTIGMQQLRDDRPRSRLCRRPSR